MNFYSWSNLFFSNYSSKVSRSGEGTSAYRVCWIEKHVKILGGKGLKGPSEQIFIFVLDVLSCNSLQFENLDLKGVKICVLICAISRLFLEIIYSRDPCSEGPFTPFPPRI